MYKSQELVSIIIPAYNAGKTLYRAIESAIAQTYTHIEIIIIDDGSQDETGTIADKYALLDNRIRVFHVSNGGEAKSRNMGLKEARGNLIAFCDADDYMHRDMIDKMVFAILNDQSDMAICGWRNVDEEGNELPWKKNDSKTSLLTAEEARIQFLTKGNIEGFCWNKLFKRSLYELTNVQYDIRRLSFCDILANFILICACNKVSYIGTPLYDYYQMNAACTHVVNIKKDFDYLETLTEINVLAENMGLVRESYIYTVNRMNKYLFGMYKNASAYKLDTYKEYYVLAYEKYLRINPIKKGWLSIKYPIENPLKFVIKEWIVTKEYQRCKNI